MRLFSILVLFGLALQAVAEDVKMPVEAQRIVDRHDKAIAEAKRVYDAAVAAEHDRAIKALQPILASETKRSNLDEALLIKAKLDEYRASRGELAPALAPKGPDSPTEFASQLVGSWKGSVGGPWTFSMKDGDLILTGAGGKPSFRTVYNRNGSVGFHCPDPIPEGYVVMLVERIPGEKDKVQLTDCHPVDQSKHWWTQILERESTGLQPPKDNRNLAAILPGKWSSAVGGPWIFSVRGGELHLQETATSKLSIQTRTQDDGSIVFDWPDAAYAGGVILITAERVGDKVKLTCSTADRSRVIWTQLLERR
jgi:hypothetical protein